MMASEEPIEPVSAENNAPESTEQILKSPSAPRTDEKMDDLVAEDNAAPVAEPSTNETPADQPAGMFEPESEEGRANEESATAEEKTAEESESTAVAPVETLTSNNDAEASVNPYENMGLGSGDWNSAAPAEPSTNAPSSGFSYGDAGAGDGWGDNPSESKGGWDSANSAPRTRSNRDRGDGPSSFSRQPARPGCRLFFGNLAYATRWQGLKDFARDAGQVTFAEVVNGSDGRSRGYGIVEYAHPNDAKRAVDILNEANLDGRRVFVRYDRDSNDEGRQGGRRNERMRERSPPPSRYGGNDYDNDAYVPRGRYRSPDRYSSRRGRDASYDRNDRDREDRPSSHRDRSYDRYSSRRDYRDEPPRSRRDGPPRMSETPAELSCQIFVNNLSYSVRNDDLHDYFSEAGSVVRANVMTNRDTGRSTGRGIVVFNSASDASRAIDLFNGREMSGRRLEVREDRGTGYHGPSRGAEGGPRGGARDMDVGYGGRNASPPPPSPRTREFSSKSNAIPVAPRFSGAKSDISKGDVSMAPADDMNGGWF